MEKRPIDYEKKNDNDLPYDDTMTENTFMERNPIASWTECTGLTPSAVLTEVAAESYGELYGIHKMKPVLTDEEMTEKEFKK